MRAESHRFTAAEKRRIIRERAKGKTAREIGDAMGLTNIQVQNQYELLRRKNFDTAVLASDKPKTAKAAKQAKDRRKHNFKNKNKKRICLKCDREFLSDGDRLCRACHESNSIIEGCENIVQYRPKRGDQGQGGS